MKIKILVVLKCLGIGGFQTEIRNIARYINHKRFNLQLLVANECVSDTLIEEEYRRLGVPIDTRCCSLPGVEAKVEYIAGHISALRPDIVLLGQPDYLMYQVYSKLAHKPVLIERAGTLEEVTRIPKIFTSKFVGVSPDIAERAKKHMASDRDVYYIPNTIGPEDYCRHSAPEREETRKGPGIKNDEIVIGVPGRTDPGKEVRKVNKIVGRWEDLFENVINETGGWFPRNDRKIIFEILQKKKLPDFCNFPKFPHEMQIQTNSLCNGRCIMCAYPEVHRSLDHGEMSWDLFKKVIDECSEYEEMKTVKPFLNNEPLLDKHILKRIRYIKDKLPGVKVSITTNGSMLSKEIAEGLGPAGLDSIWFSINGATKETYEKIMGLDYDRTLRNINYLVDLRPRHIKMYSNMIDTNVMFPEIRKNIRYWESRGVKSGWSPFDNRGGNVTAFKDLNLWEMNKDPRICERPFYIVYILYNGDVILCCCDWRREIKLGNVAEQSLYDIWNSAAYNNVRLRLVLKEYHELDICKECSYIRRPQRKELKKERALKRSKYFFIGLYRKGLRWKNE